MEEIHLSFSQLEYDCIVQTLRTKIEEYLFIKKEIGIYIELSKKPSDALINQIFDCFFQYKGALLLGINIVNETKLIIKEENIHNGEIFVSHNPLIILGSLNKGGRLEIYSDAAIIGNAFGEVVLNNNSNLYLKRADMVTVHLENGFTRTFCGENLYLNRQRMGEYVWQE